MKIAVFHNLPPGGSKRVLLEEVKYLSNKHDVDIYEFSYRKKDYMDIKPYAKKVFVFKINLDKPFKGALGRFIQDLKYHTLLRFFNRIIAQKINKGGYDFALIHSEENIGAPYILRYLRIPSIYIDQEITASSYLKEAGIPKDLVFYKKYYEKIVRRLRKQADETNSKKANLYATTSLFLKNYIKKEFNKEALVIYPGVDTRAFYKTDNKSNKILFIGSSKEKEDLKLAKDALKIVNQNHKIKLEIFALSAGEKSIRNDTVLAKKYSEAICTLCLRRNEGFGLKAVESMACETPVIAVKEGGYLEIVEEGKNGFFVGRNPTQIARKIEYLINNPQKAASMGKEGRKGVITKWNWERHGRNLERIILGNIRKTRVLISGQDSGGVGGAENNAYLLGKKFKELGFDVVFSVVKSSPFAKFLKNKNTLYSTVPLRMDIIGDWKGFFKFFILLPFYIVLESLLLKRFKDDNGKVIILPGFSDKLILTPLAKLFSLKVIWIEYGPFGKLEKRLFGIPMFFYRVIARLPDHVIVPSQNTKNKIKHVLKAFPKKVLVINIGIEALTDKQLSYYQNKGKLLRDKLGLKNKKVIGILSRIQKGKGQDFLLDAVKLLVKKISSIHLLIVGEGEIEKLKQKAVSLGVENYVTFLGYWPEAYEVISAFDVFVFPSTWELEGFGMVLLEAMNLGIPIIASDFGPIPEVVGQSALLVKPKPKDFAVAIEKVLQRPMKYKKRAKKSRIRIKKYFDINKITEKYTEILKS